MQELLQKPAVRGYLWGLGTAALVALVWPRVRGKVRPVVVNALSRVVSLADEAMDSASRIKEDLEDLFAEAKTRARQPEQVAPEEVGEIGLLTGDSLAVGESVARRLGITRLWAQVLPEQKAEVVRGLQQQGHRVVMVGEGINDSPALAAADVGIALGTGASDVAIEAADMILAGDDPRKVAGIIRLSRQTLRIIRQNFAFAIGVNGVGLLLGLLRLISPLTGALVHNLATVAVVLNSARLLFYSGWEDTSAVPSGAEEGRDLPALVAADPDGDAAPEAAPPMG